jgi:hypothetical protein
MNNNIKLPCGINKDGEVVYIDDAVNGLACECMCPGCCQPLVAKNNGKINEHHFAHKSKDFDCEHGYQSALHYMAKDFFLEHKELIFKKNGIIERYPIDEVRIEQRLDNIIPDILVICDGKEFIVEIYVTHAVDDEKKAKIKSMLTSAIEIDISHLKDQMIDKETLEQELCNPENYSWVYDADDDLVEKKKELILQYGLKLDIQDYNSIACPLLSDQKQDLLKFVPLEYCLHCADSVYQKGERCVHCGNKLPLVVHENGRRKDIVVNDKVVMFKSVARNNYNAFTSNLGNCVVMQALRLRQGLQQEYNNYLLRQFRYLENQSSLNNRNRPSDGYRKRYYHSYKKRR